jgi:hypothetical protein
VLVNIVSHLDLNLGFSVIKAGNTDAIVSEADDDLMIIYVWGIGEDTNFLVISI